MKRVKYDPKLPTLPSGARQVPLTQKQLDALIRKAKGDHAVEELLQDTAARQDYVLDNGSVLRINKFTGVVEVFTMPIE